MPLRWQGPCAQPQVKLRSSCELAAGAVGGALASCVAWLPQPPHDLVAVGHWDGSCALWRLLPGARCGDHMAPGGRQPLSVGFARAGFKLRDDFRNRLCTLSSSCLLSCRHQNEKLAHDWFTLIGSLSWHESSALVPKPLAI